MGGINELLGSRVSTVHLVKLNMRKREDKPIPTSQPQAPGWLAFLLLGAYVCLRRTVAPLHKSVKDRQKAEKYLESADQ